MATVHLSTFLTLPVPQTVASSQTRSMADRDYESWHHHHSMIGTLTLDCDEKDLQDAVWCLDARASKRQQALDAVLNTGGPQGTGPQGRSQVGTQQVTTRILMRFI
jgi:hypothetical protein